MKKSVSNIFCPVIALVKPVKKYFHVYYSSEYLGEVAAINARDALERATNKWGKHIIKNDYLLEVAASGKLVE